MAKTMDRTEFEKMDAFGIGDDNPAQEFFVGKTYLKVLTDEGCASPLYNVTFTPGCRNNWHVHHATSGGGQVLIFTATWLNQLSALAPCQCLTFAGMVTTVPGTKLTAGFPHSWYQPRPETQMSIWCAP